ncbi:MAG: carboxypeptidase-like regulatory domain-containing protein [Flavobacteriales bacterium]|nr:carboxypeptidase-like regulatory domain-containing protein [Flavobacteriales bacterium]
MQNNSSYLCVLLLFFVALVNGQEKEIQGTITNESEVEGIHILNTTSRYNTVTNAYGNFSIEVNLNDTLLISSVKYMPEKVVITDSIYKNGILTIELRELINELDEVFLRPRLTGNLETDLKNIKTEKPINFDDVGIPGFKGKPEEKIVPIVPSLGTFTTVDLEAMYKHISGYYKKLKIKRKWEAQNTDAAKIINFYTRNFFFEAYNIPEGRLYDFMLFCIETSSLQRDFKKENYNAVLAIFSEKSEIYVNRLSEKKE